MGFLLLFFEEVAVFSDCTFISALPTARSTAQSNHAFSVEGGYINREMIDRESSIAGSEQLGLGY